MDEHPDWEAKWSNDREKARARAGYPPSCSGEVEVKPSRPPLENVTVMENNEGVDDGAKSIRIHMRNLVKVEENRMASWNANTNAAPPSKKDAAVDEWMDKPGKVKLDIDTQKFAAIVRQKHGNKEKEKEENVVSTKEGKRSSPAVSIPHRNDRERESERDRKENDVGRRSEGRRYGVEMSFNKERDRERDRHGGRGRRRYVILVFTHSIYL